MSLRGKVNAITMSWKGVTLVTVSDGGVYEGGCSAG